MKIQQVYEDDVVGEDHGVDHNDIYNYGDHGLSDDYDENGNKTYQKGKDNWFNYKGLTWIEPPAQW